MKIACIIGDSGHPLEPWLLTPISNPQAAPEQRYNSSHSRSRNRVKRMFGILKSHFRCLGCCGATLEYTPEKVCKLITACAVLHNICMRRGLELPDDIVPDEDNAGDDVHDGHGNLPAAVELRRRIVCEYFS